MPPSGPSPIGHSACAVGTVDVLCCWSNAFTFASLANLLRDLHNTDSDPPGKVPAFRLRNLAASFGEILTLAVQDVFPMPYNNGVGYWMVPRAEVEKMRQLYSTWFGRFYDVYDMPLTHDNIIRFYCTELMAARFVMLNWVGLTRHLQNCVLKIDYEVIYNRVARLLDHFTYWDVDNLQAIRYHLSYPDPVYKVHLPTLWNGLPQDSEPEPAAPEGSPCLGTEPTGLV